MNAQQTRRGVAFGLAALTALSVTAFGVVGVASRVSVDTQRQDVALVNGYTPPNPGYDDAHQSLVTAQVAQDHSLFQQDNAMQENIFYWAGQQLGTDPSTALFSGDPTDPQDSIFNGAFSRFTEAQLVSQAMTQVQMDQMFGVNQTLGGPDGTDISNLYEAQIGGALYSDISGAGVTPGSPVDEALSALQAAYTVPGDDGSISASGFETALSGLQSALTQSAFSDLAGMFSVGDDAGSSAADAISGLDFGL